ncbi:MAG TPA: NlpC/P60 family protein, partial [Ferruginibacter sp.]|nr:NlpC/P60 family protein [Ferruginibacter sp.]
MLRLDDKEVLINIADTLKPEIPLPVTVPVNPLPVTVPVITQNVTPENIITYAKTLTGVPYKYGSTDPAVGFDCSGFITHVFNHFNIKVPRSSVDFTNVGREIPLPEAKAGDLVLFTGTDSLIRVVGHMG